MLEATPLYGGNAEFLDALYEQYLRDPDSVEERWRSYFAQLGPRPGEPSHAAVRAAIEQRAVAGRPAAVTGTGTADNARQAAVSRLIQVWINRGHLIANIDPLGLMPRPRSRALDPDYFGLTSDALDAEFFTGSRIEAVPKRLPLREILAELQHIYAGTHCGVRWLARRRVELGKIPAPVLGHAARVAQILLVERVEKRGVAAVK
ncbi:MAG TPA: hypothetical protein VF764_11970, partial [Steroidobacteraceae bacterium]